MYSRMALKWNQHSARYGESGHDKAECANHDIHDPGQSLDRDMIGWKEQVTMPRKVERREAQRQRMYWYMGYAKVLRKRESSHWGQKRTDGVRGGIQCFGGCRRITLFAKAISPITWMDAAQRRAEAVARKGGELEA